MKLTNTKPAKQVVQGYKQMKCDAYEVYFSPVVNSLNARFNFSIFLKIVTLSNRCNLCIFIYNYSRENIKV